MAKGDTCSVCGQPASMVIVKNGMDLISDWFLLCDSHFPKEASKGYYSAFRVSGNTETGSIEDKPQKGLSCDNVPVTRGRA